jgi:hypothetical protein
MDDCLGKVEWFEPAWAGEVPLEMVSFENVNILISSASYCSQGGFQTG